MASTDATAIPIKNQAYRVTFPIWDADGDLVTGATGLDSEVSKDGGTFTDCSSEATEIATSSGMYYLDLTATEMNADTVAIIVKTSSVGAKTTALVFYPAEAGDIIVNVKKINGTDQTARDVGASVLLAADQAVNVTKWNGTAVSAPSTAGIPEVNVKNIANAAVSTSTAQIGVNVIQAAGTAWGSGAITAGAIAANAITNTKFAAGAIDATAIATNAIGAAELAADAVTEIVTGVWNAATSSYGGAGTYGQAVEDALADTNELQAEFVDGGRLDLLIDAIKAKTDNLPTDPADQSAVEAAITAAHSTTNGKIDTVDDFLDTEIAAILADTNELQTDLVNGGRLDLLIDAIKAKTDNLPSDPADQSAVEAAITAAHSTTNGKIDAVDDYIDTEITDIHNTLDAVHVDVDAILADTNELQTDWANGGRLDLILDGCQTIGAGSIAWPYTVTDADGAPVADVYVWVTSDVEGTTVLRSGITNASGVVTFNLNPGTVYVWRQKAGYNTVNPDTETVS